MLLGAWHKPMLAQSTYYFHNDKNFAGVFALGDGAFALTTQLIPSSNKKAFRLYFLDDFEVQDVIVSADATLLNVEVSASLAVLAFQNAAGFTIFTIEKNKTPRRIDFGMAPKYEVFKPCTMAINALGDITLVAEVAFTENNRYYNGFEVSSFSKQDEVLMSLLDTFQQPVTKKLLNIFTADDGVMLHYDQGVNTVERYETLDYFGYYANCAFGHILGKSTEVGQVLTTANDIHWTVLYSNLERRASQWRSTSVSLLQLDRNLNVISQEEKSTDVYKDVIYQSRVRQFPFGESINNFILNNDLDIIFHRLVEHESGYTLIGEAFSFGPGVTFLELSMDLIDQSETVLSLYDFVELEFDKTGGFRHGKIVTSISVNVLLEHVYTADVGQDGFALAEACVEDLLFRTITANQQHLTYVDYKLLNPYLVRYHRYVDQRDSSGLLSFTYPCNTVDPFDTLLLSKDYPFFRALQQFTVKVDSMYEKGYEKSEPFAYGITDLNAMHPPTQRDAYQYLLLHSNKIMIYRYNELCKELSYKLVEW